MRRHIRMAVVAVLGTIAIVAFAGPAPSEDHATPRHQLGPTERQGANLPAEKSPGSRADTWTMVLDDHQVQPVLGKEVRSAAGENMGHVVDVIVDSSGQTRAAVIDFGGFLGVGSRKIVVDWNALHFQHDAEHDRIALDLTRDQVRSAPEYKGGKPVVVVGALGTLATPEM